MSDFDGWYVRDVELRGSTGELVALFRNATEAKGVMRLISEHRNKITPQTQVSTDTLDYTMHESVADVLRRLDEYTGVLAERVRSLEARIPRGFADPK